MCTGRKGPYCCEEHNDQNRKGDYHEGDKDAIHMRNQFCVDGGVIDDIQNKVSRMQISKTIHNAIPQGRGRINEDYAEGQSKSRPYVLNEKSNDLEVKPMKRTRKLTEKGREYQLSKLDDRRKETASRVTRKSGMIDEM